jgi:hypothetical protein
MFGSTSIRMIKFILPMLLVLAYVPLSDAQQLSHDDEANCLAFMYVRNIFGDEKPKQPPSGGWSVATPGEAITPFEPGDYIAKLERIQNAARDGNILANGLLGDMYAYGTCVPRDEDLANEYLDKGRLYLEIVIADQMAIAMGKVPGHEKDAMKEALMFLHIAIIRYPYVNEKDARIALADQGKINPADWEIQYIISNLQPSKDDLEKQLNQLKQGAVHYKQFTQDEIDQIDTAATYAAAEWIKNHP